MHLCCFNPEKQNKPRDRPVGYAGISLGSAKDTYGYQDSIEQGYHGAP
jgi:hypothetical protein